jgi:hypothetical protein
LPNIKVPAIPTMPRISNAMRRSGEQVNFAVASGIGSMTHLVTIVFETSAGVRTVP